jgi:hypothetical protein
MVEKVELSAQHSDLAEGRVQQGRADLEDELSVSDSILWGVYIAEMAGKVHAAASGIADL